jgi:hypothetical protein
VSSEEENDYTAQVRRFLDASFHSLGYIKLYHHDVCFSQQSLTIFYGLYF